MRTDGQSKAENFRTGEVWVRTCTFAQWNDFPVHLLHVRKKSATNPGFTAEKENKKPYHKSFHLHLSGRTSGIADTV